MSEWTTRNDRDMECINEGYNQALERVKGWCKVQSGILYEQSQDYNSEECFGGYRAFESIIRFIDTLVIKG